MIYLIICKNNSTCKIGYSKNPKNRLMQLQSSNPYFLELVATIDGTLQDEKRLHTKFKDYRIGGEWFNYSEEIRKHFNSESIFRISDKFLKVMMSAERSEFHVFSYLLKNKLAIDFDFTISSRVEMAKEIGMNERTIYNIIPTMLKKGYIVKKENKKYILNPLYVSYGKTTNQ